MEDVFRANPGAILGTSWGQVSSAAQQRNQPSQPATALAPQATLSKSATIPGIGSEKDDDDGDDSEYAPLTMTSWGNQDSGVTDTSAWRSLVDPNFKVRADGLGSGNLHRKKSSRYQPVDEAAIIQSRLFKQPLNTGKSKKSKKSSSKKSSVTIRPPPKDGAAGAWGSGQLLSTPFWEQPSNAAAANTGNQPFTTNNAQPATCSWDQTSNFDTTATSSSASSAISPSYQNQYLQENDTYQLHVPLYDHLPLSHKNAVDQQFGQHEGNPILVIKTEFAPGVTNEIRIWKNDDLNQVMERFLRYHHLNITDEAKGSISNTLKLLVDGCVNKTKNCRL